MTSIINLIKEIEKRPALYISKNYISCLKAFLDGWAYEKSDIEDFEIMISFQQWVQDKYRVYSSHSLFEIILFYSTDEAEALENFFHLFNDFLENGNIWQQ